MKRLHYQRLFLELLFNKHTFAMIFMTYDPKAIPLWAKLNKKDWKSAFLKDLLMFFLNPLLKVGRVWRVCLNWWKTTWRRSWSWMSSSPTTSHWIKSIRPLKHWKVAQGKTWFDFFLTVFWCYDKSILWSFFLYILTNQWFV